MPTAMAPCPYSRSPCAWTRPSIRNAQQRAAGGRGSRQLHRSQRSVQIERARELLVVGDRPAEAHLEGDHVDLPERVHHQQHQRREEERRRPEQSWREQPPPAHHAAWTSCQISSRSFVVAAGSSSSYFTLALALNCSATLFLMLLVISGVASGSRYEAPVLSMKPA